MGWCDMCTHSMHQIVDLQLWECYMLTLPWWYHAELACGSS